MSGFGGCENQGAFIAVHFHRQCDGRRAYGRSVRDSGGSRLERVGPGEFGECVGGHHAVYGCALRLEEGKPSAFFFRVVCSGFERVAVGCDPSVSGLLCGVGQSGDVVLCGEVHGFTHLDGLGDGHVVLRRVGEGLAGQCGERGQREVVLGAVHAGYHVVGLQFRELVAHAEQALEGFAARDVQRRELVVVQADVGQFVVVRQVDLRQQVAQDVDLRQFRVLAQVNLCELAVVQLERRERRVGRQVDAFQLQVVGFERLEGCVGLEVELLERVGAADEVGEFGVLAQVELREAVGVDGEFRQVGRVGHVERGDLCAVHARAAVEVVDALAVDFDVSFAHRGSLDLGPGPAVRVDDDFFSFHEVAVAPVDLELVPGFGGCENQGTFIAVHPNRQRDARGGLCLGCKAQQGKQK